MPSSTRVFSCVLGVVVSLLGPRPAHASRYPIPIGAELAISGEPGDATAPAIAHDGAGRFVVVWRARTTSGDAVQARFVGGATGELGPVFTVAPAAAGVVVSAPAVAMDAAGFLTVAWGEARPGSTCVELARFAPSGERLPTARPTQCSPAAAGVGAPQVALAASAQGDIAVVWSRAITGPAQHDLLLRPLSAAGAWGATAVVEALAGPDPRPRVAVGHGLIVVAWQNPNTAARTFLRRFDRHAVALAPRQNLSGSFFYPTTDPVVAISASGQSAAAWAIDAASDDYFDIAGQMFLPAGAPRPRGDLAPIPPDLLLGGFLAAHPAIATDRVGGLALAWEGNYDYLDPDGSIFAALYNLLGDPVVFEFSVNVATEGAQRNPAVALADDGLFFVAWATPASSETDSASRVRAALFWLPHTADPCVYRGSTFLCELLGNAILAAPIQFGSGIAYGDVPLLGDLDGDGRADPCVRRGGQFLCDLAHDGGKAEKKIVFGPAGAPAMLADVDGNGTADPCVRSGRRFLCDTAHDGGEAELQEDFGLASEIPLMGDVDGNRRADVCVFRPTTNTFACDVRHDGSPGLVYTVHPAQPGDRPLLGDVDGDYRADFCVARGAKLLCDVRHGAYRLQLRRLGTRPTDWLLLGNVDGM